MTYKRLFTIPVINLCICVPKSRTARRQEYLTYAAARAFKQCRGDGLGICKRVNIEIYALHRMTQTRLWNEALDFYNVDDKELRNALYFERLNAFLEARQPRKKTREKIGDLKLALRIWTDLFSKGVPDPDAPVSHPLLFSEKGNRRQSK